MSKSLRRVKAMLQDAGLEIEILETGTDTRTAAQAAAVAGCHLDQIAKSIIFRGERSGEAILFLTAGGNRVDAQKAAALAGEPLGKADAALVRAQTGFAIGGVSPIGHLNPIRAYFDPRLLEFDVIWAAAGTPQHIFEIDSRTVLDMTGAIPADFIEQ
ncbi:MAG: YbaK/EbsC family protein [Pseudomonadota bacterium]